MSCWRVLEFSDGVDEAEIPQLLVKPHFGSDTYTVFLTDLSNIWSEELDLAGIVSRASEEESPIEVRAHDTTQLGILLENVQKSLASSNHTTCHITRTGADGVILHTTVSLPEPLDLLRWTFHLRKQNTVTLKNELILPLLVSSHLQRERIGSLITTITEKDRVITRLVDQYESSNLDLAAAFPSIGGLKSGRRVVKREQAARYIPGLLPFDEAPWKRETAELQDTSVTTLSLFQEALSECTAKVPPRLKTKEQDIPWWNTIGTVLRDVHNRAQTQAKVIVKGSEAPKEADAQSETEDDGTEDEFETHEHFKLRETTKPSAPALAATSGSPHGPENDETTEDDEDQDLDASPKTLSQTRHSKLPLQDLSTTTDSPRPRKSRAHTPPSFPPNALSPQEHKGKLKGFKIGGKTKKAESPSLPSGDGGNSKSGKMGEANPSFPSRPKEHLGDATTGSKPAKQTFKIGGKAKASTLSHTAEEADSPPRQASKSVDHISAEPAVHLPMKKESDMKPVEEERDETAEEKAERKRRELKRKNEELAKKQAQSKKKKRF